MCEWLPRKGSRETSKEGEDGEHGQRSPGNVWVQAKSCLRPRGALEHNRLLRAYSLEGWGARPSQACTGGSKVRPPAELWILIYVTLQDQYGERVHGYSREDPRGSGKISKSTIHYWAKFLTRSYPSLPSCPLDSFHIKKRVYVKFLFYLFEWLLALLVEFSSSSYHSKWVHPDLADLTSQSSSMALPRVNPLWSSGLLLSVAKIIIIISTQNLHLLSDYFC